MEIWKLTVLHFEVLVDMLHFQSFDVILKISESMLKVIHLLKEVMDKEPFIETHFSVSKLF